MDDNSYYTSEEDMQESFEEGYAEQIEQNKRPVVLICGYTGTGKSTILQQIFGRDVVPDYKIGHGEATTQEYDKYENELIKIYDSKGLEPDSGEDHFIAETNNFIRDRQESPDVNQHIHVFWYVIQGSGGRVTDTDIKIINSFKRESTIVIISKKDITKPQQLESIKEKLISEGIRKDRIVAVSEPPSLGQLGEGIDDLEKVTKLIMPDAYKSAWDEAQKVSIEKAISVIESKKKKAQAIIGTAIVASGAAGAIPIPGSDAPIITGAQMSMIASLAALYKVGIQKEQVYPMLASVAGKQIVTSLLKLIPGAGSVISASTAVTITGGIGWYTQKQFEKMAITKAKGEEPESPVFDSGQVMSFIIENLDAIKSIAKK